jgi:IS30 family transposase
MKQKQIHDQRHLTPEERKIIETGITNGATKADISRTIAKDATTVAKEIRVHRKLKARNTYGRPVLCKFQKECPQKPRACKCDLFQEPVCNRRDKSPGACNGCPKTSRCLMDKYFYSAETAEKEYRAELIDCREGVNLTTKERDRIGGILAPLLEQGQSVHQVLSAHHEILQSERTLYNYIEMGVFKNCGVDNFSLKEQVNRKPRKAKCKPRKEPANYDGRRYTDFLHFCDENPETPITEMDTVYNDPSGPYIQTFIFGQVPFMIGILHQEKTSQSMANAIDVLQQHLGAMAFSQLFACLLTDRGSEFEIWKLFEQDKQGNHRLNIFYCDPMQSNQKPHVENNHNYVRDIIPNGFPLDALTQEDLNLMFSHINSVPRRVLQDKSPYETFSFFHGTQTAQALGIQYIPRDNVILKPSLLFAKPSM